MIQSLEWQKLSLWSEILKDEYLFCYRKWHHSFLMFLLACFSWKWPLKTLADHWAPHHMWELSSSGNQTHTHTIVMIAAQTEYMAYYPKGSHHIPRSALLMMFVWRVAEEAQWAPEAASFLTQTQMMPCHSPEWSASSKNTHKCIIHIIISKVTAGC